MPLRRALYFARRYGPMLQRYGKPMVRRFMRGYKSRYIKRGRRPYLRGGRIASRSAKFSKFSTARVGEPIGTSTSKSVTTHNSTLSAVDTRTLYTLNLTTVTKGDNRNQRERNLINVGGFKITFQVRNGRTVPMNWHLAVVSNKQNGTTVTTTDFFRSPSDTRAQDFTTAINDLTMDNLALNSDKYQILKHKKWQLVPSSNNTTWQANSGKNFTTIRWYVPLKRQLRFEQNTDTIPNTGNVFLVYWCSHMADGSGDPAVVDGWDVGYRTEMYFREPRTG